MPSPFASIGSLNVQANRFEIGSPISIFINKESETASQIKSQHGVEDEIPLLAEELLAPRRGSIHFFKGRPHTQKYVSNTKWT